MITILSFQKTKTESNNRGRDLPDSHFDLEQLQKGTKHEMEHTDDPNEAKNIAKDHLSEIPYYYDHLEDMEDEVKSNNSDEYG